ncbi:MAG: hypothetical protein HYY96_01195 [Candidatus Tectomicrobia bacterium]|nr:hypothetical protein [Candidatus Tectomicrobia bacterium]
MANTLTTNPIIVTTAAASVATQHARIKAIVWDGAANGNTLVIHDAVAGNVIFQARWATGDPATLCFELGGVAVTGIYVTTIGGGTALIYLD